MSGLRYHIITILVLLLPFAGICQSPALNFHHVTVKDGLNDGIINAITEDKYGFMWFASYGALNRFNGTGIKKYEHVLGDSGSAPGGIVYTLYCNSKGRLFIGSGEGLSEYDYNSNRFSNIPVFSGNRITSILELESGKLLLIADNKPWLFDPESGKKQILAPANNADLFRSFGVYSLFRKETNVYMGSGGGYIIYNSKSGTAGFKPVQLLAGARADAVITDAMNNVWVSNLFLFKLIRIDDPSGKETAIDQLPAIAGKGVQQQFLELVADADNVWIATSTQGLLQYNIRNNSVQYHQKDIRKPASIADNILRTLHRTKDGTIWISMLGGIDYFHPGKNVFDVLFPFPSYDANQFARGFAEDRLGHYWFSTGNGVTRFDPRTNQYQIWQNESGKTPAIYYNSSRAVLADGNNVWIATGKGINRYDLSADKMQFMTIRDSLPEIFYLNINKDSKGFTWFCSNMADGLYYLAPADGKIHSIRNHPVLKRYTGYGVRRVFEDHKHRLWLGFSGKGYAVYDPANNTTKYWFNRSGNDSSFNSNLVIDITEDKRGVVWLTTFNGVNGIDLDRNQVYRLSVSDGLPSNVTNGIRCDRYGRLWIGTSAGLALVDSSRTNIYHFDESHGFPSLEFPEHQAHETSGGSFVFPSNKGYIVFDPSALPPTVNRFPFFIDNIAVEGRPGTDFINFREQRSLQLKADENFFSITLEGLNYSNPGQTWYAYKMDGLEKEWHYTKDPRAVYTSVPGGTYTFRYKAASGNGNWNMEEKTFVIKVAAVFYKTAWFWSLVALAALTLLYLLYRYRLQQQEKLFLLEGKAQRLEKEKTQVMYDSLKQQLNPHFLFNSLTSLSGLIETDQRLAGNFLKQMSKIYRYILQSRDSETVKLKEEIDFVQTYISLQQTRFKKGLEVHIDVSEEALGRRIPPVTLQNMIENAIKHNIIDAESPLVIRISDENDYLVIRNNLQKKHMVETSNKQGLASLQSLYSFLSKKPIIIEEDVSEFRIRIPLI